jgi:DNA-binding beta-propeller fold protein YncE
VIVARRLPLILLAVFAALQHVLADEALTIAHQPITRLAKGHDLMVEATVNGPRPIVRVSAAFQVGARFGDVPLQQVGSRIWRGRVPAARIEHGFAYILHATDEGGGVASWPVAAQGAPAQRVEVVESGAQRAAEDRHLLYVAVPGVRNYLEFGGAGVLVYDIANGHRLVKRIPTLAVPQGEAPENVKGIALGAERRLLYVTTPKRMFALDLEREAIAWNREYEGGADRMALSPDGATLYVPSFEGPHWHAVDAGTGEVIRKVVTDSGAHNTIYGPDGAAVYLAGLRSPSLAVADPKTHAVVRRVGPFGNSIRPFTINGSQTLCFVNVNGLLGFEVGDLRSGAKLHRVEVQGYQQGPVKRHGCPSHGIALTPDESELWLADAANSRLHVFDAAVMPPKQVASLPVRDQPGWITFSLDGRYAYPSTGEVIDTKTRRTVATLADELGRAVQSEKMVEAFWSGGRIVRVGDQFGIGRKR